MNKRSLKYPLEHMQEMVHEKVSIISSYNRETGEVFPRKMRWQGRDIVFTKMSYFYKKREGRSVVHVFHVTNGTMDFKLRLDTENLHWMLEEVTDGNTT